MWAFLGRGFTRIERETDADIAPYMCRDNLDSAFYDFVKFPIRQEPAPTASQARSRTRQAPNGG